MNYQTVSQHAIQLYGLQVELTQSHELNQSIIAQQWKRFNQSLRAKKINLGSNWKKYGLILKSQERYTYMSAIESDISVKGFDHYPLPANTYVHFQHRGSMDLIKVTLNLIYKKVIPKEGIMLNPNRSLIHFECYNHQFHWNHADSVIHIFVPI